MTTLREACESDYDILLSWVKGDEESFRLWAGPKMVFPPCPENFVRGLEVTVKHPFSMVAESGQLIAFGQLTLKGAGRVHLVRLIVSPDHRGRGYGKQLCRLLLEEGAKRWGTSHFSLNVNRSNMVALRLYERLGFEPSIAPRDSALGGDCIYMVLTSDRAP